MEWLLLIILGIIGFGISLYLFSKKVAHKAPVCHLGEDCGAVVYSDYGKTFGIENSIGGMLYYLLIIIVGILIFFIPQFFTIPLVYWAKLVISGGAVLFSLYLTWLQYAVIKQWCEYCIASAIVTLLIFLVILI